MLRADTPEGFALEANSLSSGGNFFRNGLSHAKIGWEQLLRFGPSHLKCTEVDNLTGNPGRATREIGARCRPDR